MSIKIEGKTLSELYVKPGDVVECVVDGMNAEIGCEYTVNDSGGILRYDQTHMSVSKFRIISRASDLTEAPSDDKPKTWGEMTDAEKGALLLAQNEGQEIEMERSDGDWIVSKHPTWDGCVPYRIKPTPPEPKVETVTLHWGEWEYASRGGPDGATHRLTFTTKDGKPATGRFVNEAGDVIEMEEV